jgi:hypothetical protein
MKCESNHLEKIYLLTTESYIVQLLSRALIEVEIFLFVVFEYLRQQKEKLESKAGIWIAKIPEPFAPKLRQTPFDIMRLKLQR